MSRGNQREKAREKNLKKQQQEKKKQEGDPRKRLEAQAEIMRQKQAQVSPVSTLHNLAVKSAEPVALKNVSLSTSIDQMVPPWPIKVPNLSPLKENQIDASLSLATVKIKSPSRLYLTWVKERS
ncbi:hypothetical protein WICMUC_002453 [Wickerhamomyces mucosus]|uniref:Small EDRK-rich factor-like N-terminal domain-containing protein n=1 Tax=Wickerhamomyces mucosus TaxID=1378264 RepID=A0A9P8PP82_9ASCO|nr:hypothetical protein WICMUC_002453 [Wickerhamomyces mucosus]